MNDPDANHTIFVSVVRTLLGKSRIRLLIESLRSFGGAMNNCTFWIFETSPQKTFCQDLENLGAKAMPLDTPAPLCRYLFGDKVYACAQAEALVPDGTRSLVWIDPVCLIVQPPLHYGLSDDYNAAFRPVHIRNVGMLADQPLDAYWQRIYEAAGIKEISLTVESFVDGQRLRAYFNSHAFAINPAKGLMKRWLKCFETLVSDQSFQSNVCQNEKHQVFLFQASLSVVIASTIEPNQLLILPPVYNYPYNLHQSITIERQVKALNELVIFVYEDRSLDPREINDIEIHDPLRNWLMERENLLPKNVLP